MTPPDPRFMEIQHVDKFFDKRGDAGLHVLKDICLTLTPGECTGLVGASGSGKSTLARLLCRIHRPDRGRVLFRGQDIFSVAAREYYRQVQMVFQDPLGSFPPRMTVGRYLVEPFHNYSLLNGRNPRELAAELLTRVSLDPGLVDRYPNQLSGGQLQRIVFSRASALDPALIICDEATSALDVTIQDQVIAMFRDLQHKNGFACLFITHDLALAEGLCHTIHVMDDGALVETLTSGNIAREASHPATLRMVRAACGLSRGAFT